MSGFWFCPTLSEFPRGYILEFWIGRATLDVLFTNYLQLDCIRPILFLHDDILGLGQHMLWIAFRKTLDRKRYDK